MGKKTRKTDVSYFDLLDWYFNRQMAYPISGNAQALMSHILHISNSNYGLDFQITEKILSARTNLEVRTLRAKIDELSVNGYAEIHDLGQKKYSISVKFLEGYKGFADFGQKNLQSPAKVTENCKKQLDTTPTSGANIMNKINKKKVINLNSDFKNFRSDENGEIHTNSPVGRVADEDFDKL